MAKFDCDVHPYAGEMSALLPYMPTAWARQLGEVALSRSGRPTNRYQNPSGGLRADAVPPSGGIPGSDAAYAARDLLDRFDVEVANLIPMEGCAMTGWTDPDACAVLASAVNDYMLEHWVGLDDRFKLSAVISTHDAHAGAAEIRRLAGNPGVIGALLPLLDKPMGDRHHHPIYEAAQECGMPIVLHPTGAEGTFTGVPALAGGIPRTYPAWHALLPQIGQSHLVSLAFDGVFERFPRLRVLFTEFGFSWVVTTMWRMDKEWQNFRYEVPWIKRPPSEYVLESVRFATQPMDEPAKRDDLWKLMGLNEAASMLVFSSDYPHYDNDDPITVGKHIPDAVKAAFDDNAAALFGGRLR
ncbi:amidohydrolase family protein [Conexibacter sp. CPCC 206217]|uniref:amidohydrolase family protein n=1 Tax=Conexibacter sp. CPCC 206217 TaxID=3064574 RepID=UPI0027182C09|nr:amidohydrolase family protein [Conexibacter sp. CPCC 206217]MDO8208897.1 amidohydrolase family protein [Conexibacter sp. CPCC 206217]